MDRGANGIEFFVHHEDVRRADGQWTPREFELEDLTGGKDHYQARVVSDAFSGKTPVQQHQMVYQALAEEMKGPIHALALKTFTKADGAKKGF